MQEIAELKLKAEKQKMEIIEAKYKAQKAFRKFCDNLAMETFRIEKQTKLKVAQKLARYKKE